MSVTSADIQGYQRDGVICIRSVIDPSLVQEMYDASIELMNNEQHAYEPTSERKIRVGNVKSVEEEPGRFFVGVFISEHSEKFRSFALDSPLPEVAAALMQSEVARFFYDQLFIKEPGTMSPTLWHHDMPFWPLTGSDLISCWVALTPATKESSGLEYVAGSQKWDKFYRPTADYLADEAMEPAPDFSDPANRVGQRILSWDMQRGDVLFHHPLVVHGAGANRSSEHRRVGLSVRYIGDDAQWAPRQKTMKLAHDPLVPPGEYPADDVAFPIAWAAVGGDRPPV